MHTVEKRNFSDQLYLSLMKLCYAETVTAKDKLKYKREHKHLHLTEEDKAL